MKSGLSCNSCLANLIARQMWLLLSDFLHLVKYSHCQFCARPTPPVVHRSPRGQISSGQNWGKKFVIPWLWSYHRPEPYRWQMLWHIYNLLSGKVTTNASDDICKVNPPKKNKDNDNDKDKDKERCVDMFIISSPARSPPLQVIKFSKYTYQKKTRTMTNTNTETKTTSKTKTDALTYL